MKKEKKSRLSGIPAWALSLMTFFLSIGLFEIFELLQIPEPEATIVGAVFYMIYFTSACFVICRIHPKSVWYTPFICNGLTIFVLIMLLIHLQTTPDIEGLIYLSCCIALSVVGALYGAKIGRGRSLRQI